MPRPYVVATGCSMCLYYLAYNEDAMERPDGKSVLFGTQIGELKEYNLITGQEEATYLCSADRAISMCHCSKDRELLLTSSSSALPPCALWSFGDVFEMKHPFSEDTWVKFSNLPEDRIIGTHDATAHIYDTATGQRVLTLHHSNNTNNSSKNLASFNPTDDLVLNDGVIWDVKGKRLLHKFDKFNNFVSGVFHPSGLEIIINSEIRHRRSFHLLDTCPSLDQCRVIFNNGGDVMYGVKHLSDPLGIPLASRLLGPYETSFRGGNEDYARLRSFLVWETVFAHKRSCGRTQLALKLIIKQTFASADESVCRVYEVGRLRRADDEDEHESDEGGEEDDYVDDDDDENDDDDDEDDDEDEIEITISGDDDSDDDSDIAIF
ncbi:unnamed protein product [Pocillopora meandrina]|uniref:Uncharacterized protein n=1 Tax=Pocillopora meandrina TaxID=46732 RepID=A0AAU9XPC9_9CNID|nr:unnamed protein product [Pocillopora meandrina]